MEILWTCVDVPVNDFSRDFPLPTEHNLDKPYIY